MNPDAAMPGQAEEGLLVVDYNTNHHTMIFQYKFDSPYDTRDLIAYAEDASEGKTCRIIVFECGLKDQGRPPVFKHHLFKSEGAGWHALATMQDDALRTLLRSR